MIRPVTSADLSALVALAERMHDESIYADTFALDLDHTRALFTSLLQGQGRYGEPGAAFLRMAVVDGTPTGFIAAALGRVYHLAPADHLRASDHFCYHAPDGDPRDGVRLLHAFFDWAESQPNVVEIVCGATDAVANHKRVIRLYERRGFRPFGAIYRKDMA